MEKVQNALENHPTAVYIKDKMAMLMNIIQHRTDPQLLRTSR